MSVQSFLDKMLNESFATHSGKNDAIKVKNHNIIAKIKRMFKSMKYGDLGDASDTDMYINPTAKNPKPIPQMWSGDVYKDNRDYYYFPTKEESDNEIMVYFVKIEDVEKSK